MADASSFLVGAQVGATSAELLQDWLQARQSSTRRAYARECTKYAEWAGHGRREEAMSRLLAGSCGAAQHQLTRYRTALGQVGLAPASINRALSALRSFVAFAAHAGRIDWTLSVQNVPSAAYRDTAGPTRSEVRQLLDALDGATDPAALRDRVLVQLLYFLGLRRAEAASLDQDDLDLDRGQLAVVGKGRREAAPISMPDRVVDSARAWLRVHPGSGPNRPLLVAMDRRSRGHRLSGRSVARIVRRCCARAGIRTYSPHALRHAAITHALDATEGNVRLVRAFSRHARLDTLVVYDDNRNDGAGRVANLLAS